MEHHYSKGYGKYGASMGRGSDLPNDTTDKLSLQRVRLDSGGYDPGGSYWGGGYGTLPLYRAENENGDVRYLRAANRDAAKVFFPKASFYR
jgi:hypothetical protein